MHYAIPCRLIILSFCLSVSTASSQTVTGTDASQYINQACADFVIHGPCSCTGLQVDQACLQVSYHAPMYLIETILRPNDSVLDPGVGISNPGDILEEFLAAGGSGATVYGGRTALTFRDVRVYTAPLTGFYGCNACTNTEATMQLVYDSTQDQRLWRLFPDFIFPIGPPVMGLGGAGSWGWLFPRNGYSSNAQPVVAAALTAWRGLNIAFAPITPTGERHEIQGVPTSASNVTGIPNCFQVAYPQFSRCGQVGMHPMHWSDDATEFRGRNVFTVWGLRTCCVDPAIASCGQGLGAEGTDNFCRIPPDPIFSVVVGMPIDIPFDQK